MKKDKRWLKNKTYNLSNTVMNLDGNIQYVVSKIAVLDLISKLDEPELPTVPRFVSDFIDEVKPNFNIQTVFTIKNHKHKKAQDWAFDNSDLFARAWTVGCTIEKEKQYWVELIKGKHLVYNYKNKQFHNQEPDAYIGDDEQSKFFEQEIKEIDERYLYFAVEVTE